MDGIKIDVTGNIARVVERPARITSGTVGLPVEFTFDDQWEDLSKIAVFRAGRQEKITEVIEGETIVPWEILEKPNMRLHIGVNGVNDDGTVVISTIWANVGVIFDGADMEPEHKPTITIWRKLETAVGNLLNLKTRSKSNLVDAINEVYDELHGIESSFVDATTE